MTILEHNICTIAEWLQSNEIESLISELQMISERKYFEEEKATEIFPWIIGSLDNLSIFK